MVAHTQESHHSTFMPHITSRSCSCFIEPMMDVTASCYIINAVPCNDSSDQVSDWQCMLTEQMLDIQFPSAVVALDLARQGSQVGQAHHRDDHLYSIVRDR